MAKYLKIGFVRELELKLNREEISYSKMVELIEEECIKNYKKETLTSTSKSMKSGSLNLLLELRNEFRAQTDEKVGCSKSIGYTMEYTQWLQRRLIEKLQE